MKGGIAELEEDTDKCKDNDKDTEKCKDNDSDKPQYNDNDVLCGRGGRTNQHIGNRRFLSLVRDNREQYLQSEKSDKPFIVLYVVHAIRRRNGRFLKKDEKLGLWIEIGDRAARDKAAQALRRGGPEFLQKKSHRKLKFLRPLQQKQQSLIGLNKH